MYPFAKEFPMDRADRRILELLQQDSSRSIADLSAKVGISASACHRRIKALEHSGVIDGYAARLNPHALGYQLQVYVEITLTGQSEESMERFEQAAAGFDDILDCRLMAGAADYQLRVAARDLEHFDHIHRTCLSRLPGVSSMRSSFVIRTTKAWTGYPLASR